MRRRGDGRGDATAAQTSRHMPPAKEEALARDTRRERGRWRGTLRLSSSRNCWSTDLKERCSRSIVDKERLPHCQSRTGRGLFRHDININGIVLAAEGAR